MEDKCAPLNFRGRNGANDSGLNSTRVVRSNVFSGEVIQNCMARKMPACAPPECGKVQRGMTHKIVGAALGNRRLNFVTPIDRVVGQYVEIHTAAWPLAAHLCDVAEKWEPNLCRKRFNVRSQLHPIVASEFWDHWESSVTGATGTTWVDVDRSVRVTFLSARRTERPEERKGTTIQSCYS